MKALQGKAPERDGDPADSQRKAWRNWGFWRVRFCAPSYVTPSTVSLIKPSVSIEMQKSLHCTNIEKNLHFSLTSCEGDYSFGGMCRSTESCYKNVMEQKKKNKNPKQDAELASLHSAQTQSPCSSDEVFRGSPSSMGESWGPGTL